MSWFGFGGGSKEQKQAPADQPVDQPSGAASSRRSRRLVHAQSSSRAPTGSSLFDRYASTPQSTTRSARSARTAVGNLTTRTTRMRTTGVRLACYLNGECNHGRATIIHLPDECDTLAEVLPKVQARMQLDKRMLYAAELFLPNGDRVRTYETLTDAAAKETAIIVGCGEPFDPTTVPFDILEFHLHGGGRQAARTVKKELQDKKKLEAHEKADSVRASGHGVYPNSVASVTARSQSIESNRGNAAQMRHEYMEQLMFRASQQKELVERVQENNAMQRMEMREAKLRREEAERERLEFLATERREQQRRAQEKREASKARIKLMHDKVRSDWANSAALLRHKKLAAISGSGSSIEVRL